MADCLALSARAKLPRAKQSGVLCWNYGI